MDISSPKKNQSLRQGSDKKMQGVVDLRSFAEQKKSPATPGVKTGKVFYEIKSTKTVNNNDSVPRNTIANEKFSVSENSNEKLAAREKEKVTLPWESSSSEKSGEEKSKTSPAFSLPKLSLPKFSLPSRPRLFLPKTPLLLPQLEKPSKYHKKAMVRFAVSSFMIPIIIFSFSFAQAQLDQKGKVLGVSTTAYDNLKTAAQYALASNFTSTQESFNSANLNFAKAKETIDNMGNGIGEVVGTLPINTPISTAQNLTQAGENVSLAGKDASGIMEKISLQTGASEDSLSLENLKNLGEQIESFSQHLKAANEHMQEVDLKYIPAEMQDKIKLAKEVLPAISGNFEKFSEDYPSIMKMLGSERPQKYLLLFENSSEMRATGGFIGSYGILDIENGKIKNLQIDGIFNPDGQLKEKIVPPMPIQKISASWSMHDSNWFADFPTSAKKVALFYEKTGGETVDGVIAITPDTIKKLLEISGPIEMPAYGVTITADNFVQETQNQVEDLYNKTENKPKKILSDLAPILINKLFKDSSLNQEAKVQRLLGVVQKTEESLGEKDILMYHRNEDIEKMIQKRGWGGEITQNTKGDYLAVINSNINGYKTDAVVEENMKLETEIKEDGSIIDTLTIRRKHNGGNQQYDWYNRVNADYMRVYVPKGSILLQASGNTAEDYVPSMDYKNFKTDPDVEAEEKTIKIDPESKTQIFEESGKTVFGNWVYVSPQEETTIVYKYQLPFKANFDNFTKAVDAYSVIVQKQAGSAGSNFEADINIPKKWKPALKTDNIKNENHVSEKLTRDLLYAEIFSRN